MTVWRPPRLVGELDQAQAAHQAARGGDSAVQPEGDDRAAGAHLPLGNREAFV